MPLNGIKLKDYHKICDFIRNASLGYANHIEVEGDSTFKKLIEDSLIILLTREIGRKLIFTIESDISSPHPIAIQPGEDGHCFFYKNEVRIIEMNPDPFAEQIYEVEEILPTGLKAIRKVPTPFFIDLAHELVHASHERKAFLRRLIQNPTLEPEYDNLEEQFTISGFLAKVNSAQATSDENFHHLFRELTYSELNERTITAAFVDKKMFGIHVLVINPI